MRTGAIGRRPFYRQGKTRVYLEPLEKTLAVRYKRRSKSDVRETLRYLGRVTDIESQRLFVVQLRDSVQEEAALEQLQQMVDAGVIGYFTPVLRDKESQLLQILTDEITVRFKQTFSQEQLREVEARYGVTAERENEFVPNQFIVKVARPEGLRTLNVANKLHASEEVEFAAPNFISQYRR